MRDKAGIRGQICILLIRRKEKKVRKNANTCSATLNKEKIGGNKNQRTQGSCRTEFENRCSNRVLEPLFPSPPHLEKNRETRCVHRQRLKKQQDDICASAGLIQDDVVFFRTRRSGL